MTSPQPQHGRPRQSQSLKQQYEEFILQRIEEFKDQISRADLLAIADDAVRELEMGTEEQLVLTEVLLLEHVDRLIIRRLRLPAYRRWRDRHVRLRRAQKQPTHWGLDPATPLVKLVERVEEDDLSLVVGAAHAPAAFYLAAHDVPVLLIDPELQAVEAAETRAAAEAISARFQAAVVSFGTWFPEVAPALVILDPALLARLDPAARQAALGTMRECTIPGGTHLILPTEQPNGVTPLGPEALQAGYKGWSVDKPRRGRPVWFTATKP